MGLSRSTRIGDEKAFSRSSRDASGAETGWSKRASASGAYRAGVSLFGIGAVQRRPELRRRVEVGVVARGVLRRCRGSGTFFDLAFVRQRRRRGLGLVGFRSEGDADGDERPLSRAGRRSTRMGPRRSDRACGLSSWRPG